MFWPQKCTVCKRCFYLVFWTSSDLQSCWDVWAFITSWSTLLANLNEISIWLHVVCQDQSMCARLSFNQATSAVNYSDWKFMVPIMLPIKRWNLIFCCGSGRFCSSRWMVEHTVDLIINGYQKLRIVKNQIWPALTQWEAYAESCRGVRQAYLSTLNVF